jgi:hypothetical protein
VLQKFVEVVLGVEHDKVAVAVLVLERHIKADGKRYVSAKAGPKVN